MKRRNVVNPRGLREPRERYIHGLHPVREWLRTQPKHIQVVYCDASAAERTAAVRQQAAAAEVPVRWCPEQTLAEMANSGRHQGVVAKCEPFPYQTLATVFADTPRLVVVADHLQDPHNLGALLRTAAAVGVGAIVIPKDGSVPVTATVESAAAGAAALLPVCRVTNVGRSLAELKRAGYWIVGLAPHCGRNLFEFDPPERVVMVLGGESGIRPLVAEQCDFLVSIPMEGRVESLNASVAAAVVLYQLWRRRGVA
jgi:23S rRNA (guanosine2251-2'-O)-methyltransferase